MTGFALRHGTWVAVCDGRKAIIFENAGDHAYPKLEMRDSIEQEDPATHVQGSAPPGRTFSSVGNRRSAIEETDLHDQMERTFLHHFALRLDRRVRMDGVRSLILVAPARALGMIRPALSVDVRHVLVAEVDKDYVALPAYRIEKYLKSLPSRKALDEG